jgi:hypothetical protein
MDRRALSVTLVGTLMVALMLVQVPAGAAPTTLTFDTYGPGLLLTNQASALGVTFPQGLEVYDCGPPDCITAHSGNNAVRGTFQGEFARDPFEAVFTNLQKTASLWVRSDQQFTPAKNIIVTMNAYNAGGTPVGTQTKNFASNATWTQLSLGSLAGTANIKRIVVSGGQDDTSVTNFLSYDDLSFDAGDSASPSPSGSPSPGDATDPTVTIVQPPNDLYESTTASVPLEVRVQDAGGLQKVDGRVDGPGDLQWDIDLCGTLFSGVCPSTGALHTFSQTVSLEGAVDGLYVMTITARDPSFNSGSATRLFDVDVPAGPSTVPVRVYRMEVNQAVQTQLSDVPGRGTAGAISSSVQLIEGKDMLVRWYLFGDGAPRPGTTGRMEVALFNRDGSLRTRSTTPNAGATMVDLQPLPPDDERAAELLEMRADPTRTLNFVIPGSITEGVETVDLQLHIGGRAVSGGMQKTLGRPLRIGLNVVRLSGPALLSGPPPISAVDPTIIQYVRRAMPVTEVRHLSSRSAVISDDAIFRPIVGRCSWALFWLNDALGGDDTPVGRFTRDANIITTMGFIGSGAVGPSGCAYVGDADDTDYRRGGTLITQAIGDTAAQEIAHQMGLIHAGNDHGEEDGGDAETPWPYTHGTIGSDSFGAVMFETTPPGTGFGEFSWILVDPCPTSDMTQRVPTCMLPDNQQPHDYMSYGNSNTDLGSLITGFQNWTSPVTYRRMYAALAHRDSPDYDSRVIAQAGGPSPDERLPALMLNVFLDEAGNGTLLPLLHKDLPASDIGDAPPGDFDLSLLDGDGNVLFEDRLGATELTHQEQHAHMLRLDLPFVTDIARVLVEQGGATVLDETASTNPPVVDITSPSGGETFENGMLDLAWTASDADGDPLYHLVQFSPDGGSSWQGITMVTPGNPTQASVDVSELISGTYGLIRVVTSDGINTDEDVTDVFFAVGTDDPPATDDEVTRNMRLRLNELEDRLKMIGVLSAKPSSCAAREKVVLKRNGKKVASKRTNDARRVTFTLRDRPGRYQLVAPRSRAGQLICLPAKSIIQNLRA